MPFAAMGQLYPSMLIPDSLKENAHEVIWEETFDCTLKSESEGAYHYHKVVTLLNSNSSENEIYIPYDDHSRLKKINVHIYDALGVEVRKVSKDEIKDYAAVDGVSLVQDSRFKHIELNYTRYPYTVEIEYEKEIKETNMLSISYWPVQRYNQSIMRSSYSISLPEQIPLHYKMLNSTLEPTLLKGEGQLTYSWQAVGLKAVDKEPYSPGSLEILPSLLMGLGSFEIEGHKGSLSSWDRYSRFYHDLWKDRKSLPDYVVQEVHALTDGLADDRSKIRALYKYLQQNMRYVSIQLGIGGIQPFTPEFVAENKYGDCKALSNYMCCMLSEVGIEAYPALVYGGRSLQYDVEPSFTFDAFNHVIVYVPSEDLWLECTSNSAPTGYLSSFTADRNTLLVKASEGNLKRTPVLTPEKNTSVSHALVSLQANGSAEVNGTTESQNALQDYVRLYLTGATTEEKKDWWLASNKLPGFQLNELDVQLEEEIPIARLSYEGLSRTYASKAGKRIFVPLHAGNGIPDPPEQMKERQLPVKIDRGYTLLDTTVINLPDGYQIESMNKEPVELTSAFGTYKASFERRSGQLVFIRYFQLNQVERPAEEYEQFRDFLIQASKADKSMAVLVERKT
jgi:hypothetical protein